MALVCTGGRTYADVKTKISRIDRLPNLVTHARAVYAITHGVLCYGYGAPLARGCAGLRKLRYNCEPTKIERQQGFSYRRWLHYAIGLR